MKNEERETCKQYSFLYHDDRYTLGYRYTQTKLKLQRVKTIVFIAMAVLSALTVVGAIVSIISALVKFEFDVLYVLIVGIVAAVTIATYVVIGVSEILWEHKFFQKHYGFVQSRNN